MHNAPLSLAPGAGAILIDGIDVGQLLQGLGEASASNSPVDLFGLCLGAQRALAHVHAASASARAYAEQPAPAAGAVPQRERMTRMFEAIDADSQRYVMAILQGEFDRAQKSRRPALRLIDGSSAMQAPTARATS